MPVGASRHEAGRRSWIVSYVALVTDQLDEWWDYVQTQDIEMRSTEYIPVEGRPHHGFVAIDPEGYFLEFERFLPHPENADFMPLLDRTETLLANAESNVPQGLGFKATIVWFYCRVKNISSSSS